MHLHNVILGHLHNASIQGAAALNLSACLFRFPRSIGSLSLSSLPLSVDSRPSNRRAKSSRVIRQISRIWSAREIFTKPSCEDGDETRAGKNVVGCNNDLCTRPRFVYEAFTSAKRVPLCICKVNVCRVNDICEEKSLKKMNSVSCGGKLS